MISKFQLREAGLGAFSLEITQKHQIFLFYKNTDFNSWMAVDAVTQ